MTENTTSSDNTAHHANYFVIFMILCVLTMISIAADMLPIGNQIFVLATIALSVAIAKALFVMLYFMHLKFEKNWKYILLTPTITLAICLPLSLMSDISLHYYPTVAPQTKASGTVFDPQWATPSFPEPPTSVEPNKL